MKLTHLSVRYVLLTYLILYSILGYSQKQDTLESYESSTLGVAAAVWVDSIVISASRKGFDIEDFILLMKNDTSMYRAFQRLRTLNYSFPHEIQYYKKNGSQDAYYEAVTKQVYQDSCRWNEIEEEGYSRRYFKRKKYRYYTSSLFSRIFYTKDTLCSQVSSGDSGRKRSAMAYHVDLMKQIIFSPGLDIDIPFVGRKMALFSEKMRKYYTYTISSSEKEGVPCYVFSIEVKPQYQNNRTDVIVRKLETYFKKEDFTVVYRKYNMRYDNRIYDFDFDIEVKMGLFHSEPIPMHIRYDGNWDIPFKRRERARFIVDFQF